MKMERELDSIIAARKEGDGATGRGEVFDRDDARQMALGGTVEEEESEHDIGGFFLNSWPTSEVLWAIQGAPSLGFFMSSLLGTSSIPLLQ